MLLPPRDQRVAQTSQSQCSRMQTASRLVASNGWPILCRLIMSDALFPWTGSLCSPSQGQCCTSDCKYVPALLQQQCKEAGECSGRSTCNGISAKCPDPPPRPDLTECNGNTQVCQKGECSGSICLKWGLKECFLTSNIIDDKRKLCELACQEGNDNSTCKGTSELAHITKQDGGISLRAGSPCDNYQVIHWINYCVSFYLKRVTLNNCFQLEDVARHLCQFYLLTKNVLRLVIEWPWFQL